MLFSFGWAAAWAASNPATLIVTTAGSGIAGYSGEGGPAQYAALNHPEIMVFDTAGNLYVAESANNRVRKISVTGNITTVAGNGSPGFSGDNGAATQAQLNYPIGLALDGSNNLYIVDQANQRVRKVALNTGTITTVVGTGAPGFSGDGGQATSARINNPHSIAADSAGNLYIADQSNQRVRWVNTSGVITTIAGTGAATSTGDGNLATLATLNAPTGIALDSTGTILYVAENSGHLVRRIVIGGNITTVAGTGTSGFSGDGSAATAAKLASPLGLSLDASGNLYISDRGNQRIRMVSGTTITTIAGNGSAGFSGDGGNATAAALQNPIQAIADAQGNIYISDWDNHRIRKIIPTPTGNPTPSLTSIYPSSVVAGSINPSFTLTVYGSGFMAGATVQWNGSGRATTYVSSTILTATILSGDVQNATTAAVTVVNSGNATASGPQSFTVLAGAPTSANNTIITFAGNGSNNYGGDGGPALYASLSTNVQMVFDATGNMYFADCGNNRVRKIDTSGTITTIAGGGSSNLENIPASAAQLNCPSGVALDTSGNLYIAEYNGHRVRKVALATNSISTYAGPTATAGNNPGFGGDGGPALQASFRNPSGLAIDPAGNLYVVDRVNERVRKITPGGTITTIAGNGIAGFFGDGGPAVNTPLNDPYQIARDTAGNLYISEINGQRIRKIDTLGNATTVAGNGNNGFSGDGGIATNANVYNPEGLIVDSNGNLYFGDAAYGRVRMVTGGIINTIAGTGNYGFSGDGGTATAAQVSNSLNALAVDSQNRLYLADTANNRIRRIQPVTSNNPVPSLTALAPAGIQAAPGGTNNFTLTVYGTNFVPGATVQWNGSGRATTFQSSTTLYATINYFDIYTATTASVTVVNPATGGGVSNNSLPFTVFNPAAAPSALIVTFAGNGITGYGGNGGPAIDAALNYPQKMVFDGSGNMYVAEYRNHTVRKITPAGIVSTVAGTGNAGFSGDTGPGIFAQLNGPIGVALDGNGNLYIGEYDGNRIRKVVLSSGIITTIAGNGTGGFTGDSGPAAGALVNHPVGMASDSAGNLYFADQSNQRIRKISAAGIITTVAGNGVAGYFGDGGTAVTSFLYNPTDVALDPTGTILYIADEYNHRIRKVDPSGNITTVAGNGNGGYSGDGVPAIFTTLYYPVGVAVDSAGNLYIGDNSNYRVRKVNTLGIISTIAGNGRAGYSGDGGLATGAQLYNPQFVALDPAGNVYVDDVSNNRIRELIPAATGTPTPVITSITPSAAEVVGAGVNGTFTITVTGTNFIPGSYVQWSVPTVSARNTTYVSSTTLLATINYFDIASVGTASITVFNPGGGGTSNSKTFTIIAVPAAPTTLITTAVGTGLASYAGDTGPGLFASIHNPQAIAFDASGNLYIADANNNVVRKVTTGGTITTFAGTGAATFGGDGGPATFAQLNSPVGLAFDSSGNLYIADQNNYRIRQVTPSGIISTIAGNGTNGFSGDNGPATAAKIGRPQALAIDPAGNLYVADYDNQRVRKIVIGGNITTFAGTGVAGYFGDGGPATTSTLYYPVGVAADSAGNVYIADQYNHRIRKVDTNGNISTVAGNGNGGFAGDGGAAASANVLYPSGVSADASGNLYIADEYNHRIRKVTNTGLIFTIAGNGTAGFSGDGGPAVNAELYYPQFTALDSSNNLYISDSSNNRIRKLVPPFTTTSTPSLSFLSPTRMPVGSAGITLGVYGTNFFPGATVQLNGSARTTTFVSANLLQAAVSAVDLALTGTYQITVLNPGNGGVSGNLTFTVFPTPAPSTAVIQTIAGSGYAGYSGDGGQGLFSALNNPVGLVVDLAGNLYIADYSNNRIRKMTPSGIISTFAGNGSSGFSGDGGPATQAQFSGPAGLALDTFGNLYVADYSNNRIRKITPGGTITTVAGNGTAGFSGDGAAATLAKLNNPFGVAVDSNGNIFIADRYNHRIRKVDTSGNISTYAGNGIAGYFGDGGPATTTSINEPMSVALDLTGNLYIAEYSGHRIRRVATDGTIYTVAGTSNAGYNGDGVPATSANLYYPVGVFVDTANNIYIADSYDQRIREVTGGIINTVGGNGGTGFLGDGGVATNAQFYYPEAVTVDSAGNIYVSDNNNNRIRKILAAPSKNPVPSIGSMQPASAQVGGADFTIVVNGTNFVPGSTIQWNGSPLAGPTTFVSSTQLTALIKSYLVAIIGTANVTVLNPTLGGGGGASPAASFLIFPTPVASTAVINTFSGNGTAGSLNGAPGTAEFNNPNFITFDAQGNLYVADYANNLVRKITSNGTASTIAGGGSVLGDGGQATAAKLNNPGGVAIDGLGNLYISEFNGHRIRRVVLSTGVITTIAGNGVAGFAGDNGPAANSQLNQPDGLALDAQGNLYFAEYRNYRIRKIAIANGVVGNITTIGGNGISGYFGDGGPAVNSPLVGPASIAIDTLGNVYFSDYDGNRIRMIDTAGIIHLVAGTGSYDYSGDGGPAIYATFRNPNQLTIDTTGNIYVADRNNNKVRKIDSTGIITTIAGTGTASFSGDGGLAANATLNAPNGVALDSAGDLFIADASNNRIREVGAVTGTTCLYSITPGSAQFGAAATTGSFNVNTSAGCFWSTGSNANWLTITSATGNAGPGSVSFSVASNTGAAPRSGTITAAGLTYTANQSGTGCSFTLNPTSASVGAAASSGNSVGITAPTGCSWTAVSNSPFIHITSGSSGSGSGSVVYSVDPNATSATLSGSMTIAGQVFQVTQAASACTYSLLTSNANYSSSFATGTVGVIALSGCTWTAASSQSWLTITAGTSGSGNGFVGYSVAANTLATARSATITVSGTTGLIFTVNQQAFVSPVGNVSATAATGAPGGSPRIPILLNLPTGQLDSISFGVSITPINGAPPITAPLSFAADALMPTPTVVDTTVAGSISVSFLNIPTPITGTVALGQVQVTIPGTAISGQTYTITITGASGSSAGTPISLSAAANATLLLSSSYLVGDGHPFLTDLDSDSKYDDAGEFGDGSLTSLDLIYTLRQVVSIPGYTAAACSDRFDALDSFPVDTANTRGGDGVVDNLDLLETLRRVTNIDTSRPIRGTRGLVCANSAVAPAMIARPAGDAVAQLEMGAPQSDGRIPVYLRNRDAVSLAAISFSITSAEQKLTFIAVDSAKPSLNDNGVTGWLAVSWLNGFYAPGGRTLIGYVSGANGAAVQFNAVNAHSREGQPVRIDVPAVQ